MGIHFVFVSFVFRYGKTVPQVLLRWSLQKNYVTIPKTSRKERIVENADVFDFVLSEGDMKILVGIEISFRGIIFIYLASRHIFLHTETLGKNSYSGRFFPVFVGKVAGVGPNPCPSQTTATNTFALG